jgi:polyferredoxin
MAVPKIILSDVFKKYLKVAIYLLISGVLGYVSATYVAKDPALTVVFTPVINFILLILKTETDKEGVIKAIEQK